MLIQVGRDIQTTRTCTSNVHVDDEWQCYFLEDPVREKLINGKWVWRPEFKIPKKTAIPSGTYPVIITLSRRFKRLLPLIVDVPDFVGVRIHPGNDAEDTEGCPLPGQSRRGDWVSSSVKAFDPLFEMIASALEKEKVFIEFKNDFKPLPGVN